MRGRLSEKALLVVWVGWWLGLTMVGKGVDGRGYPVWCSPKLWEAKEWALHVSHSDQGPQIWEIQSQFSVDVIGNRFASHETGTGGGASYSVFRLFYYATGTLFTVQDGKCTTTQLTGNITQHCFDFPIQDTVESLKESWGGDNASQVIAGGVRTLNVQGVGRFDSVDIDYPYAPLVKEIHGTIAGVPTYRMSAYYNVTFGIQDPAVFTPPSLCIN